MARARSQGSSEPPVEDPVNEAVERIIEALPQPGASRVQGNRTVTATLPNGRVAWLSLRPTIVSVAEANAVARKAEYAAARQAAAARSTAGAIDRLKHTFRYDWRQLARGRVSADRDLLRRIGKHEARLDKAFAEARTKGRAELREDGNQLRRAIDKLRRRRVWEMLVLVSAAPLFAAYGSRGDPFAVNNFTLAITLLVWLVGEEFSDWLTGEKTIEGGVLADVDVWAYVAPFANLLAGWWLLNESQHERFLTGLAGSFRVRTESLPDTPGSIEVHVREIDVASLVAPDYQAEFASFSNVRATATIASFTADPLFEDEMTIGPVTATVNTGNLRIEVVVTFPKTPLTSGGTRAIVLTDLEVAWMIDTREPPGS
jgi:hypothetical protein